MRMECDWRLHLYWQDEEQDDHISYLMVSQLQEGVKQCPAADHFTHILTNNQTVYNCARTMQKEYRLKLISIEYPPLVLVFRHSGEFLFNEHLLKRLMSNILPRAACNRELKVHVSVHTEHARRFREIYCCSFDRHKETGQRRKKPPRQWSHDSNKERKSIECRLKVLEDMVNDYDTFVDTRLKLQDDTFAEICSRICELQDIINLEAPHLPEVNTVNSCLKNDELHHSTPSHKNEFDGKVETRISVKETLEAHRVIDSQGNEFELTMKDSGYEEVKSKLTSRKGQEGSTEKQGLTNHGDTKSKRVTKHEVTISEPDQDSGKYEKSAMDEGTSDLNFSTVNPVLKDVLDEKITESMDTAKDLSKKNSKDLSTSYTAVPCPSLVPQGVPYKDVPVADESSIKKRPVEKSPSDVSDETGTGRLYDQSSYDSSQYPSVQSDELNIDMDEINMEIVYEKTRSGTHDKKDMVWAGPEGQQRLRLVIETMIGSSSSWSRLNNSVEEALRDESVPVSRAEEGLDTVLCVDTSGSLEGGAFHTLKQLLVDFIDEVANNAENHGLEENIAIVTFGGRARVLHHLSNDYQSLRDSIATMRAGGPSPLLEGLVVSLACLTKGGIYNIDVKFKLPPRLIFICDGYPTRELDEHSPDTKWTTYKESCHIQNAFKELFYKQMNSGLPDPIVYFTFGNFIDESCFLSLSNLTGGEVVSPDSFLQLAKYLRLQSLAVSAVQVVRSAGRESSVFNCSFHQFLSQLGTGVSQHESQLVYDIFKKNLHKSGVYFESPTSFDNVHEDPELPPLGSRVVRGPDWQWGNQDTEGPGTIINHSRYGIVYVCWDNDHVNIYRFGNNGKYDVITVPDLPRQLDGCMPAIGAQVVRGPDWQALYEDQDGGEGSVGVVIRVSYIATVLVRWQNGKIYDYRSGLTGMFDVSVRDNVNVKEPEEGALRLGVTSTNDVFDQGERSRDTFYQWQRKDELTGWESYQKETNEKLQRAYKRKPFGTCLVQRNKQSFRVSFKTLQERSLVDGSSVEVQKVAIDKV